jgi:uncharacterized protein YndB with AHSA1/START domain
MAAQTKPIENELVITRLFDAPRDLVFRVWADPRHAVKWFGPIEYPATDIKIDARPGGSWRAWLTHENGTELRVGGTYREIVPPERLVFTFTWEEDGERGLETVVTITFAEQKGKTLMTFRQSPFRSDEQRDGHNYGWNSAFDRLDAHLAKRTEA